MVVGALRAPVFDDAARSVPTTFTLRLLFLRPMNARPKPSKQQTESPIAHGDDHPDTSARNARSGLALFFVYLLFYGAFMGLAAFAPDVMARPAVAGVNVAIVYGLGLIGGALVVAAIYMWFCGRNTRLTAEEGRA